MSEDRDEDEGWGETFSEWYERRRREKAEREAREKALREERRRELLRDWAEYEAEVLRKQRRSPSTTSTRRPRYVPSTVSTESSSFWDFVFMYSLCVIYLIGFGAGIFYFIPGFSSISILLYALIAVTFIELVISICKATLFLPVLIVFGLTIYIAYLINPFLTIFAIPLSLSILGYSVTTRLRETNLGSRGAVLNFLYFTLIIPGITLLISRYVFNFPLETNLLYLGLIIGGCVAFGIDAALAVTGESIILPGLIGAGIWGGLLAFLILSGIAPLSFILALGSCIVGIVILDIDLVA